MITGNPDLDFFEQNPLLKYKDFFHKITDRYSKKKASKICWALYYSEHPDSPLYNVPRDDRKKEISKNYVPDIDWELIESYRKEYLACTMTKEKLLYKITYDKLEDLTYNLEKKDLDDDKQWRQAVILLEKLSKIWNSMEELKSKYEDSVRKGVLKGGGKESARQRRQNG